MFLCSAVSVMFNSFATTEGYRDQSHMQNDDGLNLENICCPLDCSFPLKNTVILKMNFLIQF
jgi:hypothetical protein